MKPAASRHRSDLNASPIIDALRQMGVYVVIIGKPTDWLLGISGYWFVAECKNGKGKYTLAQQKFAKDCETFDLPMMTLRSVEHAVEAVNAIRRTVKAA